MPAILRALSDPSEHVRLTAGSALREFRGAEVTTFFLEALESPARLAPAEVEALGG